MRCRLWTYPWDVLDEGLEVALPRIKASGAGEISLAMAYHDGMFLLPHNPRTRVRFLEDGVVYFRPELRHYDATPIKPIPSRLTTSCDPLKTIADGAVEHGVETTAWLVTLHNSGLGSRHPEYAAENVFGDRYPYALCPGHPEVQRYVVGLVADASSRYRLSAVELEALHHQIYPHQWAHPKEGSEVTPLHRALLSLCFCKACTTAAQREGVNVEPVRRCLREVLDQDLNRRQGNPALNFVPAHASQLDSIVPGFSGYVATRTRTIDLLVAAIVSAAAVPVHAIVGSGIPASSWVYGVDLQSWARQFASLTVTCYGNGLEEITRQATAARSLAGDTSLTAGLQAIWPAIQSRADLIDRIEALRRTGIGRVSIFNYGLMPLTHLEWLADALASASNA